MQGYRKAEVQGREKNDKERKPRVGSRREMENKKVVMDRRTEIQRIKKNISREHDRDRARGKKKSTGRRMGNWTLEE